MSEPATRPGQPAPSADPDGAVPDAEVVHGVVRRVTYHNPDSGYVVLRLATDDRPDPITVVGYLAPVPAAGQEIRAVGRWVRHPSYGRQFEARAYQPVTPRTCEGIERFLASGAIKGVGPTTARRLVERFGERTLDVLASRPDLVADVPGVGARKAQSVAEQLARQRGQQEALVLLHSLGVGPGLARRIVARFGDKTMETVQSHPYLLALEVGGIGFRRADELARRFGLGADDPQRLEAALWHALQESTEEGHVYLPQAELYRRARDLLASGDDDFVPADEGMSAALDRLARRGSVVVEAGRVYPARLHRYEVLLARRLAELARPRAGQAWLPQDLEAGLTEVERRFGVRLAPEQRLAVRRALEEAVLVITGGPGTGKTTLVRFIVHLASRSGWRVGLAAPTGRAAQRLQESVGGSAGAYPGMLPARTLHRLLEPRVGGGEAVGFARNRENPLDLDLLVVDEASMLDLGLAFHLVEALRPGSRLVLVGDVDQLPSVGPGQVLRDIIEAGTVGVVRLTRLFRQASMSRIVTGAHQVLAGKSIVRPAGPAGRGLGEAPRGPLPRRGHGGPAEGELRFVEEDDPAQCARRVAELVASVLPERYGLDPLTDIQVLAAAHKGPAGADALNERLQAALNPPAADRPELAVGHRRLRLGDRVMQTKNEYQARVIPGPDGGSGRWEEGGVFNGEIGRICQVDERARSLRVRFDDGRVVEYDEGRLGQLELAYAVTVHKSQGNEFPCVVMPVVWTMPALMTRHLLYTAITRGRRLVVLVGQRRAVLAYIRNASVAARYSHLARRLQEAAELMTASRQ